jgi:group II intron reverse transcriptase/maturase
MSPELLEVMERAKGDPNYQFFALAHLIDESALERSFRRIRKAAVVGVDGVTVEKYAENLGDNLKDLLRRLKEKRYRHQPIRRVHIPKAPGKTRPIGVSTVEDKVVQGALRELLEAVYEATFLNCSFGFRPGRSAHDALRALNRVVYRGRVNWILEADIVSFFDSIDRKMLQEMLQTRVLDGSVKRLVGKCLKVGVLDGETFSTPDEGTAQGSIISPLFGNVYLHYVLDAWFESEIRPALCGEAHLIRYADDFAIGFETEADAVRVKELLTQRFAGYGLTLHPAKTRLIKFQRPAGPWSGEEALDSFDFLGFTCYWRRTRKTGRWEMTLKTRRARLSQAISRIYDWCRVHRHLPVAEQHAALTRRLRGHINYFGVNGNGRSLTQVVFHATQAWFKWLCRRSQKTRLIWKRFEDLLRDFPLPTPRICVQIWGC